jgi:hypothetical protein
VTRDDVVMAAWIALKLALLVQLAGALRPFAYAGF